MAPRGARCPVTQSHRRVSGLATQGHSEFPVPITQVSELTTCLLRMGSLHTRVTPVKLSDTLPGRPVPPKSTRRALLDTRRHECGRAGGRWQHPPPPRGARPRQAGPAAAAEPREWRWGLAAEPASAAANRRGPRGQRRRVHVSGPPGPAALCAGVCVLKPPPASSFWDWHRRATHCPLCGVTRLQTTVPAPSRAGVSRASCVQGRGGQFCKPRGSVLPRGRAQGDGALQNRDGCRRHAGGGRGRGTARLPAARGPSTGSCPPRRRPAAAPPPAPPGRHAAPSPRTRRS